MSKILTVFGATGIQGGSVIRAILADKALSREFTIRGITRDVNKPAAQALTAKGVQVVKADMSSPKEAHPAVQNAHTIFLVTNFWESMSPATEIAQGKAVTDAAKAAGVKHIIFSSLLHVSDASNGRLSHVTHFDSKAQIEAYIRASGVPSTFVQPGLYMTGLFGFIRQNPEGKHKDLVWAMPEGVKAQEAQLPLLDAERDTGLFVRAAVRHFPATEGRRILAATEYYTPARIMAELEEVTGKKVSYMETPHDAFKTFLPKAAAEELFENMLLLQDPGYYAGADLQPSLQLLGDDKPITWKAFARQNKDKWA
ncbi:hypothetical protein E4U19_006731 [Claviceps sp. Clav32 group G5]|nr:hypothetical protein E4U19_006731 [Claviceps sp. Clav32 group G5]KAG6034953.1 hypothetical protein E4U40_003231 [Claviceps sp. LM458 group G5]